MGTYVARFDAGAYLDSPLVMSYQRSSATRDESGSSLGVNFPRYSKTKLLMGVPVLAAFDPPTFAGITPTEVASRQAWGGRWYDGSPCLIVLHVSDTNRFVDIYVNTLSASPYSRKNIKRFLGGDGSDLLLVASPNESAEDPRAFATADGMIVAACVSRKTIASAVQEYSCSFCYWDDSASDWKFISRFPTPSGSIDDVGKPRGQIWMLTGPWCRGRDTGAITDCFFAMTDYRNRPAVSMSVDEPRGGFVGLVRAQRTSGTAWTTAPASMSSGYLYEFTFPDFEVDVDSGMHAHSGSVLFNVNNYVAMVVHLAIGDDGPNNRIVKLVLPSSDTTFANWNTVSLPVEPDPTTTSIPPPDPSGSLVWKAYEDRNGQRRRLRFTGAVWVFGSRDAFNKNTGTLTHASFARLGATAQVAGMQLVFVAASLPTLPGGVEYVNTVARIVSHTASSTTITVEWYTFTANDITNGAAVNGEMWADPSMQFVGQVPLADTRSLLVGGDENLVSIYKAQLSIPDTTLRFTATNVFGVPPELRYRVSGTPTKLDVLNWNCLRLICARPRAGRQFIAYVNPGSIPDWQTNLEACQLLYSYDGVSWGDLFQYRHKDWSSSGWFGYDKLCLSVGTAQNDRRLAIMDAPWSAALRPINVSPGTTNVLNKDLVSGGAVTFDGALPFAGNTLLSVSDPPPSPVPPPPSMGPILECTMIGSGDSGRVVISYPNVIPPGLGGAKMRLKFWIYVKNSNTPANYSALNTPPFAAVGGAMRLEFGVAGNYNASFQATPIDIRAIGGAGWVPITVYLDTATWNTSEGTLSVPSSAWTLAMWIKGIGGAFVRQQFLIAFDSLVVVGSGEPDCPSLPLVYDTSASTPPTSGDELLTLSGFTCGGNWTATVAARNPETGADPISATNGIPSNRIAFMLAEGASGVPTKYISVVMDRSLNRLLVKDHAGSQLALTPAPISLTSLSFQQTFYFLKGKQILVTIVRGASLGGGLSTYTAWASVGGTVIGSASGALADVSPVRFIAGTQTGLPGDAVELFAVSINDSEALSDSVVRTSLRELNFITQYISDDGVVTPIPRPPPG